MLKALEEARNEKHIGSSLEAKVVLTTDTATTDFCSIISRSCDTSLSCRRSRCTRASGTSVEIQKADGEKCERCWNYSTRVGEFDDFPTVCERCIGPLREIVAAGSGRRVGGIRHQRKLREKERHYLEDRIPRRNCRRIYDRSNVEGVGGTPAAGSAIFARSFQAF